MGREEKMKTVLIVTTSYNNPAFIELQKKCFDKFILDDFDFAVANDSDFNTKSLISGGNANAEIIHECERIGLRHIRVPQNIHNNIKDGGLVPDGLPANHPTERHRATLHWILKNS